MHVLKMKFLGPGYQRLRPERDIHTDRRDRVHYQAAFAGDNNLCLGEEVGLCYNNN